MTELDGLRAAIVAGAAGGADEAAAVRAMVARAGLRTVVFVEGTSDRIAVEALAASRHRDLTAERVCVVPMGGAMSIGRFLRLFAEPFDAERDAVRLRGLCDLGEEGYFRRGLEQAGLGTALTRTAMESLGFTVCVADIEDELIRALGAASVVRVVAAQGDLRRLRTFQHQPAQRGRTVEQQLRRFLGTTSGRKAHYAHALVRELDPARVPRPLDRLLAGL